MKEATFFPLAFIFYILALIFYFSSLLAQKEKLNRLGSMVTLIGFLFHNLALILRTIESGHAPFTNMYESLSFFAWSTVLALLLAEKVFHFHRLSAYLMLLVIGLMALASSPLMPKEATPLVPALQSYWLWLHVSVTLLGEAFLAVAFVASLLYLFAAAKEKKSQGFSSLSSEKLDSLSYRAIAIGFPLFTLGGLVFGMVWANVAWGRYWAWDPKEVWTLITWFFYALYLHTRIVMGWKGKRSAWIAIIGFLAALFTYFGVNYLLSGLHSYV
ncbi:MAG: c-type cytochrome biogenesis protein CcsB [Candidatus Aminicenantes bacterium]|nr:c-type cytochrome biogenesis protein CcsB [Candidatus Aminicenantes bacterium]